MFIFINFNLSSLSRIERQPSQLFQLAHYTWFSFFTRAYKL